MNADSLCMPQSGAAKARRKFVPDGIRGIADGYPMTTGMELRLGLAASLCFACNQDTAYVDRLCNRIAQVVRST